jgi:hypothetical protein
MIFNEHSSLQGEHAFLRPSYPHWVNYSPEKLDEVYWNSRAAQRGVELHEFAHLAIRLKRKQPRNGQSLNAYVNDAIGYQMESEQILYYSENCFGTADTVGFRSNFLRIHDLKTGLIPGSIHQLEIYAALFCLEYGKKPGQIDIELRIYQNDEVEIFLPGTDRIAHIMDKIIQFDRRIERLKAEG